MSTINRNFGMALKDVSCTQKDEIMLYSLERNYSYSEVNILSDYIAREILRRCGRHRMRIGLYLEHTPLIIIAIIAVLKTGCSYVPISKKLLQNNKRTVVAEAQLELIISDEPWCYTQTDYIDIENCFLSDCNDEIDYESYNCDDEVYVLFTSGSTGVPKGCSVTYGNLEYIISGLQKICPVSDDSVYLFSTPYHFDVSTSEIYSWLAGGKIFVLDLMVMENLKQFPQYVHNYHVSHFASSPSGFLNMINIFSEMELELIASELKYVMIAGEAFKKKIYDVWLAKHWGFNLLNLYGPTEATVYATYYQLPKDTVVSDIPIGICIDGCSYEIINKDQEGKGELVLKGQGITAGYINNPEENEKRFYQEHYTKCYRTGDIVAERDGMLFFYGRNDDQIQIHGMRVEIGEIENSIRSLKGVLDAAVIYSDEILIGNVVVENGVTKPELLKRMNANLPKYMVPNYFEIVDELARTANNKVDRKRILSCYKNRENAGTKINCTYQNKDVQSKVISLMKDALGNYDEKLDVDSDFFELGGDSLSVVSLLFGIEKTFKIECTVDMIYIGRTPRAISECILEKGKIVENNQPRKGQRKSAVVEGLQLVNIEIFEFLLGCDSPVIREYPCCHNQYVIYNNKIDRSIFFDFSISKQYSKEVIISKLVELIKNNPILHSKILNRDGQLFFVEYAAPEANRIPYLDLQDIDCELSEAKKYIWECFEKLITKLRYQNGILSLFVLLEDENGYHIVAILDHCVADASSVSIIKKKLSRLLNNLEENSQSTYFDYCTFWKHNNSLDKIVDSIYLQERKKCMVSNVDHFISNIADANASLIVNDVITDSSVEISILIAYIIGKMTIDETGLEHASVKTILNLREYDGWSFKDTLGDMHSNVSFLLYKDMRYQDFREKAYDAIKTHTADFVNFTYVHLYQRDIRFSKVKEILDRSSLFSVNYLGDIESDVKKEFDVRIREVHRELYSVEKKIFATAYRCAGQLYILINKDISHLSHEISLRELENM